MIYLASDHAGFKLKEKIKKFLENKNYSYVNLGAETYQKQDDYPDFAFKLGKEISKNKNAKGILVCGTGQGISIAANKIKGVVSALSWDVKTAKHARKHLNSNVLAIPGTSNETTAGKMIDVWLKTKFVPKKRFVRRLKKIKKIERKK